MNTSSPSIPGRPLMPGSPCSDRAQTKQKFKQHFMDFSVTSTAHRDNRDLREIPLDLELHQIPARLVSPRWKKRDRFTEWEYLGPSSVWILCMYRHTWGRSSSVQPVCNPCPTKTSTSVQHVLRSLQPACLLMFNLPSLTFASPQ